jgi:hypothetical protein
VISLHCEIGRGWIDFGFGCSKGNARRPVSADLNALSSRKPCDFNSFASIIKSAFVMVHGIEI